MKTCFIGSATQTFLTIFQLNGIDYESDPASITAWETYSELPFNFTPETVAPTVPVQCLSCMTTIHAPSESYILFRMKDAPLKCASCAQEFTASSYSVKRVLNDMRQFMQNQSLVKGTVLDHESGKIDKIAAQRDMNVLLCHSYEKGREDMDEIFQSADAAKTADFHWPKFQGKLVTLIRSLKGQKLMANMRKQTMGRVARAYRNMWWSPETMRYRQFLILMEREPTKFFVPTLDIDLNWHTHQCFPLRYQQYGVKHTGRLINHDDAASNTSLGNGFAQTAKSWKKHFNEAYSTEDPSKRYLSAGRVTMGVIFPPYMVFMAAKAHGLKKLKGKGERSGGCSTHDATPRGKSQRDSKKGVAGVLLAAARWGQFVEVRVAEAAMGVVVAAGVAAAVVAAVAGVIEGQ
ncbi:hypothetical protein HK104_002226 [Borealophlyctis nickersoniae]|nr:hypothetical protein HK104_002226 [Borealophlyctis nickersoniae]